MTIPALDHYSGSWIIVSRDTGESVMETYQQSVAEKVNQSKYEVLTALQYLVMFNQSIKGTI